MVLLEVARSRRLRVVFGVRLELAFRDVDDVDVRLRFAGAALPERLRAAVELLRFAFEARDLRGRFDAVEALAAPLVLRRVLLVVLACFTRDFLLVRFAAFFGLAVFAVMDRLVLERLFAPCGITHLRKSCRALRPIENRLARPTERRCLVRSWRTPCQCLSEVEGDVGKTARSTRDPSSSSE